MTMPATTTATADIVILGGGLIGLTLALALDAHGISTIVIDPAVPATQLAPGFDGRASAVASASWKMLSAIGVGARLEGQGNPIARIQVSDQLAPEGLAFDADPADGPLGLMFENRALRHALAGAAADAVGITLWAPAAPVSVTRGEHGVEVATADGRTARGALLVAAEGRNSPTRIAAGIAVARWSYDHVAIVSMLGHERPHDNVAHEIFWPAGPFALLPMKGGHRSALVWTVSKDDAPGVLGLGPRGFLAEAEKRMDGLLGAITLDAPRSSYPLGFHHAARITDRRLALAGDAAHGIHPIAGQGLNLGFRDVAALAEVLVEGSRLGLDLGDAQLLARYERWRALDTGMVAMATDTLTRLFGLPGRLPAAARRLGIGMVDRLPPLKARFMAEARGEAGALPALLTGALV